MSSKALKSKVSNIPKLKGFSKAAWSFLSSIYKFGWNLLYVDGDNNSFRNRVSNKFTSKVLKSNTLSNSSKSKDKVAKIVRLSLPIPACPPKEVLEKSKFFGKRKKSDNSQNKHQTILCSSNKP